jgi:hypothetical protein
LFLMGAKYVWKDYDPHTRRPHPQFLFHLLCMFSLTIVRRTTNIGM